MGKAKKGVDWGQIEIDYRLGLRALRDIAAEHGIVEGAIRKRAKRGDWVRDLSAKARARADVLVQDGAVKSAAPAPEVRKEVRKAIAPTPVRKEQSRTEKMALAVREAIAVEAHAHAQARIRLTHRAGVERLREMVMSLVAEAEVVDDLAMPLRASVVKALVDAFGRLVAMEREAYGIEDRDPGDADDPLTTLLRRVQDRAKTVMPVHDVVDVEPKVMVPP